MYEIILKKALKMANLSKNLGQRIKELRKLNKMTQAQLSECIGMETTNLCKLENGSHMPKEENIEKLAEVFNVPIKELFDFGHVKSCEKLQQELISVIKNSSQKDLELYHKVVFAIREHC